ncbi:MAG: rhomboid family intramembrane serine protease [Fulvivirga sp.]|nr:rhomboid family intramembrane serine protease [Fulvivirga sp.]
MNHEGVRLRKSIYTTLTFVALIWFIKILEFSFGYDFSEFGILPRTLEGSIGIITAPLVHGDVFHLLSNTFPIIVLGVGLFYFYDRIAFNVIILIYLITGFWVWIAARDAYHVGASGIVYGLLTFLLFSGFFRKDRRTLAISFIVLFLYGTTLVTGVLPSGPMISWESHLMGAIAGVFCAIYFKGSRVSRIFDDKDKSLNDTPLTEDVYVYQYKKSTSTSNKKEMERKQINYTYLLENKSGSSKKD